jgi:hypothetical protein
MGRNATSQAAWSLLTEGVTRARVEAHRLQHLCNRASALVQASPLKEEVYQAAGDIIVAVPDRLGQLMTALDRTSLALAKMADEVFLPRMSLSDKETLDEAFVTSRVAQSLGRVQ